MREGLDLPEVSLIAILDADKEGFLRSETSLIQTIGRAARNVHGKVIMYADRITNSMQRAMDETNRRREIQTAHNQRHGITPVSIRKSIQDLAQAVGAAETEAEYKTTPSRAAAAQLPPEKLAAHIGQLEEEMYRAAEELEFERAAELRDEIAALRQELVGFAG